MFKFLRPEFFDIFGIGTFSVITYLAIRALFFGEGIPFWGLVFMLVVGILGLIVDGNIVFRTYIARRENTGFSSDPMVK